MVYVLEKNGALSISKNWNSLWMKIKFEMFWKKKRNEFKRCIEQWLKIYARMLGENWLVLEWCRYLFHAICIHFVFILSPCSKLICCCWMKHMNTLAKAKANKKFNMMESTSTSIRFVQRQIAHMSVAVARCTLSLLRVNAATTSYVQWKWCVLFILANFRNWFYSSLFFLRSLGLFFACKQTIQTQTK